MGNETEDNKDETAELNKKEHVEFSSNMSQLLANFSSASMLSSSGKHKELSDCGCRDIISTLRTIHIHRPISSKHRLRRLLRRFKQDSQVGRNHRNLAVAASCHLRPLLWPGRLSRNRRSEISKLIHPARLKYHPKSELQDSAVTPAKDKSSASFHLNFKVVDSLRSNTSLDLSIVNSSRKGDAANVQSSDGSKAAFGGSQGALSSFSDLSKGPEKECATQTEPSLRNSRLYRLPAPVFSSARRRYISSARSRAGRSIAAQRAVSSSELPGTSSSSALDSTAISLQSALPGSEGGPLSLSCSQEVRMEETNVNELASYLEDFLHIPRKMSTMAEMMYA